MIGGPQIGLNLANACNTTYDDSHPYLLKCPEVGNSIDKCQKKGKRVLLSIGGASGAYGFPSDASAQDFAKVTWEMFLGGKGTIRPFGSTNLDGIDLDIEGGSKTGYATYAKTLRGYMDSDSSKP